MERTLLILKPNVCDNEPMIRLDLQKKGFTISHRSKICLTQDQASDFLGNDPNDESLPKNLQYMTSGPIVVMVLIKYHAISALKAYLGLSGTASDVTSADPNNESSTAICRSFRCSESSEDAENEISFFFPDGKVMALFISQAAFRYAYFLAPTYAGQNPEAIKSYLDTAVYPTLIKGLTDLCKEKPAKPVKWLGDWLLENHPNIPKVVD
ncbi:nucleoside diphosphate kinase [Cladochytrium replicatum]|nr:nucleoside diphosphate kinase [Cladochytrium replicatum]